ncbi:hypothetical protein KR054_001978 [Drosophila jambulina]|nr:hypothetical protein KR054_001978 [Drosophila jambulina]
MKEALRAREPSSDEDSETTAGKKLRLVQDQNVVNTMESMMHGLSYLGGSSIELKLENLSCFLSSLMESHKQEILRILETCVLEHPGHVSAYATFVGLANVRSFRFGADCIQFMVRKLRQCLLQAEWQSARIILRFLVDLLNCNVITSASLLKLLTAFVAECEDPCEAGAIGDDQARCDWLALCVLSALPFVGKELNQKAGFEKLMLTLQIYVKKRSPLHVPLLSVWRDSALPQQLDQLESLWHQVKAMAELQWAEPDHQLLPRPYLAFDERLSAALQHSLPSFEMPPHQRGWSYPQSELIFRIFDFRITSHEELKLPPSLSIERYLLEDHVLYVLKSHHLDRKKCAKHLLSIAAAKLELAVCYSIVEVILGEMLRLPKAAWPTINYGSILIELCRLHPYKMPPVVMQAANIIYSQLEFMNVACFDRLVNWLSLHLSNFGYHWHWAQWAQDCLGCSYFQPKAIFLRELVGKCIRLSYYRKIATILPQSLARFFPPLPHPQFKYIDPLISGAALSEQLLEAMRDKQSDVERISALLKGSSVTTELRKINVFTQNCLHLSSKSFSHTFATLAKYLPVFKDLARAEEEQLAILEAVFEVWYNNQHYILVVIERMIRMEVIMPKYVVSWLFGPLMRRELTKMYIWELLHITVRLVQNPQRLGPRKRHLVKDEIELDSTVPDSAIRVILFDIVQRIIKVLCSEAEGPVGSDEHYRFQWILGRLQEVLFTYVDEYQKLGSKLVKISEDADLNNSIAKTVQAFLVYVM